MFRGILVPVIRSSTTAVAPSGLSLERGGSSAVGRGRGRPAGRSDHDQQHCYHHVPTVNQRLLLQLLSSWWWARGCPKHVELLFKRQVINLRNCCIWLVDSFECHYLLFPTTHIVYVVNNLHNTFVRSEISDQYCTCNISFSFYILGNGMIMATNSRQNMQLTC